MSLAARAHGLLLLVLLGLVYAEPLVRYAQDQHYQTHFAVLWLLFGIAVVKGFRGPLVLRGRLVGARALAGGAGILGGSLVLALGVLTGSSTLQRTALAATAFGLAAFAVPAWSLARVAGFAAFLLLCFGVPFSAWFAITKQLARGLGFWLEAGAPLLGYRVEGLTAVFPHFRLTVTGDCSGFNQLVTFVAVGALGTLVAAPRLVRSARLLLLGVALAYVANVARLFVMTALVAAGATRFVTDETWHQLAGFAVDLPFLVALVAWILRTHVALPVTPDGAASRSTRRGAPLVLVPLTQLALVLWLGNGSPGGDPSAEPAWFARADAAPGHALARRARSEAAERVAYGTPWLVNTRHVAPGGATFDLFAFETRSRRHLNVHSVANCLEATGAEFRYGEPFELAGRRFFPFESRGADGARHGYYLFRVAGTDRDDSWRTQLGVLVERVRGGADAVGMVRVIFPGPAPRLPTPHESEVLAWAAGLMALAP